MPTPRITLKGLWRLYHTAQALIQAGRTDDAIVCLDRVASAPMRRSRAIDSTRRDEERRYLQLRARLGLCYCLVEQGKLDAAADQLAEVLKTDPTNAEALCELAYILSLRGERGEARLALETAIRFNPESARAHKALGYFCLQNDDLVGAIAACEAAIACDPGYDLAHVELAVSHARAGQFGLAVDAMERALEIAPHRPDYYFSLASLLRDTHRVGDAAGVLAAGLEIDPNHPELLETAAEVSLELGEAELAIDYAQRLLRVSGRSLAARDVLGVAYLQQGRVADALRIADQLVALNPLDASHHFKKAVLFQQQGMFREAMDQFVRVLRLAPDSEMGQEAMDAVEAMDRHQLRQIVLVASEDAVFRMKLRRDSLLAARERGFVLSEAGEAALQSIDLDNLMPTNGAFVPILFN